MSSFYRNPNDPLAEFLDEERRFFNLQHKKINQPDEQNSTHWLPMNEAYRENAKTLKAIRQRLGESFDGVIALQIMSALYDYEMYQRAKAEEVDSFLTFVQGFHDDIDMILQSLSIKLREQ